MSTPLVSIIVPVYNVELYLEQCLESIIQQTFSNLEIIVINDGSTDNSFKIIKEFSNKDSRFIIIDQENKGISSARNSGINISSGDYLMFVDSDDWIAPNTVEVLLSKIYDTDLVACSYNRAYVGKEIPRIFQFTGNVSNVSFQRRLVGLINEELNDPSQIDSLVTVWAKLYKSKLIKDHNIEFISTNEIGTCEDLIFNLFYLEYCTNVYISNEPLYFYRKINLSSFTSKYKSDLFLLWKNLFNKLESLTKHKGNDFEIALNNRIALSIIGLGINELQNEKGFFAIYENLRFILNNELYIKAYSILQLKYFPNHWRIFFFCSKHRIILGVYLILLGIKFMIDKNNEN